MNIFNLFDNFKLLSLNVSHEPCPPKLSAKAGCVSSDFLSFTKLNGISDINDIAAEIKMIILVK